MRRLIAEIGAVVCGLFAAILPAGVLFATAANLFWPVFLLLGAVFYWFARVWMFQVLEVKRDRSAISA